MIAGRTACSGLFSSTVSHDKRLRLPDIEHFMEPNITFNRVVT